MDLKYTLLFIFDKKFFFVLSSNQFYDNHSSTSINQLFSFHEFLQLFMLRYRAYDIEFRITRGLLVPSSRHYWKEQSELLSSRSSSIEIGVKQSIAINQWYVMKTWHHAILFGDGSSFFTIHLFLILLIFIFLYFR